MRQIALFKYVCTKVHEGFAFCGDTAQAIAKGIGFRFEDIRCLFFRKFLLGSEKGKISKKFQLSKNFHTHAGVLNLAQSIIDLLSHFFPLFVAPLRPETSRISGELPILLETDINNNAVKTIFGRKGADGCQQVVGFGAEQVVLVRDGSLKEKVVDMIGKNALVLTIMESKGLEFQDVLLYDFFTTSAFSNEWRIIYEYMKEKGLPNLPSAVPSLSFNMEKHAVLCSELKQLYVAITRTRQRLWICVTKGFSRPIYDYWKKLSLVEVKHLSDSFADKMQIPSSKHEWRQQGIKIFCENNFRMARMCFSKAVDMHSERLAEAYELRANAESTQASQLQRKKLLKDAAMLFSSVGKNELAAECFYEIEDYKTAGDIYLKESMLEKAGNCYYLAKCYELAAEVYEKAGAFTKSLSACADGKLFEIGFQLICSWGRHGDTEQEFLHKGALYYFGVKNFKRMMKFVRFFHSKGEMRSFLNKKKCLDELILLEIEWGNFEMAVKVARLKPDPVLEADLLRRGALYYLGVKDFRSMMKFVRSFLSKDEMRSFLTEKGCLDELILLEIEWGNFEDDYSIEAALSRLWYVFFGSLWACGKRAWPLKDFKQKDKLLDDAKLYVEYHSDSQDSALVHTEISVLSNVEISLSQMGRYLMVTPRERSLRIHFVISRSILDVHLVSCCTVYALIERWNENGTILKHLEDVLSKDIVSVEGLVYFWNHWKEMIQELINWSCTWGQGGKDSQIYEDFIFNYFGVRKYDRDENGCYVLLNAEAQWVKQMNPSMLKSRYLYIIHAREFSSVASRYWCSELLFVAEKVLRKLHCLHAYSTVKNFSMHQQTKILYSLFEVAESLQKCKLPYGWYRANRIVDRSFQLCLDQFWSNVFHINWKIAQSKEMMSLRGNIMFLNMLEEAIKINSKSQKGLTCGQLGRIAMTFLGSRMIGFNDDTKRKVRGCSSMNWRDLFDKLKGDHGSSSKNGDLAIGLHNVLKETRLCAGWRRVDDCMSAACFFLWSDF